MRTLALITARGGSKSIPQKNLALLGGRPLLAYTCAAALECAGIERTVLSTDDPAIADVGRRSGVDVPFMRPQAIAGDSTPSVDVAIHAVDWLEQHEGWRPEVLLLLQPTSPFRTSRHLEEGLALFHREKVDTVVSVIPVPHRYAPYSIMELHNGRLQPFWKEPIGFDRFHRQSQPKLFARNGPAVLITRVPVLKQKRGFYGDHVAPYFMNERDSIDIDCALDLIVAEALLTHGAAACAETP